MTDTYLFHNIGNDKHGNYHTPEQIKQCKGNLTFDGIYLNVYEQRHLLKDRNPILYFMGDYIGKDNKFDQKNNQPPLERYCTMEQLKEMESMGCILGWHTWSHPWLTGLTDFELKKEVTPVFPMDYFCYPYGDFDARVIEAVKEAGFKYAHTCTRGDNSPYQMTRRMEKNIS